MQPHGRERLSVVIPTWNEAEHLPELLASLRSDPDAPEEIVVVDGGSSDSTREIAARSGARVLESLRGRGSQLARGAEAALGELLFFLHADARISPRALGALRASFRDPRLLAAGLHQRIDKAGLAYRVIERAADQRVRCGWVYGDSGLAVRRSAYEEVGGFRSLPLFEDLDLSRRLRRKGAVRIVPGAWLTISARRWEREGVLARTMKNWALTLAWLAGVDPVHLARYYPTQGEAVRQP